MSYKTREDVRAEASRWPALMAAAATATGGELAQIHAELAAMSPLARNLAMSEHSRHKCARCGSDTDEVSGEMGRALR